MNEIEINSILVSGFVTLICGSLFQSPFWFGIGFGMMITTILINIINRGKGE